MENSLPQLKVAGLGPGHASLITPQVLETLAWAETVVGYHRYLEQVPADLLQGRDVISTGMKGEVERCKAALDAALAGKNTLVVSGGDAGVYGMAGLVLELAEAEPGAKDLDLEVLPGIPALCAAAALLGAPLTHDFASVSLSDLLTPWEVIEKRVRAALQADFVLALYNPRSKRRDWQLPKVLEAALELKGPDTVAGLVRQAYRPGQSVTVTTLDKLDPEEVDMLSILVLGNASTRISRGRMLTPRGYANKYNLV